MLNKLIFLLLSISVCFQTTLISHDKIHEAYQKLSESCISCLNADESGLYSHIVALVSPDGSMVSLEDGSIFSIKWWYRAVVKKWKKGAQIYITYDSEYKQCKIQNSDFRDTAWGEFEKLPTHYSIQAFLSDPIDNEMNTILKLNETYAFKSENSKSLISSFKWQINDQIIVFANSPTTYQLWNPTQKMLLTCHPVTSGYIEIIHENRVLRTKKIISNLEERLNKKVIQQPDATKALTRSLLIYYAGLKSKEQPVGVFLFLGPSGVGKTELAKALNEEIFEKSESMIRFDMSQFSEKHTISRLIGNPVGYSGYQQGGQLTNPLWENSEVIVLLDEMEKAHPEVHKFFLPVFDEGYVNDRDNKRIDCSKTIFIMTSNLCGPEIAELYRLGYSHEDILTIIEPELMKVLTPELYNRVEPVLFRPLSRDAMVNLVDILLLRVEKRIWIEKEIEIFFDASVKEFLIKNGFHPALGARPLSKLIENKIVARLAYKIIFNDIPDHAKLTVLYDHESECVEIIPVNESSSL